VTLCANASAGWHTGWLDALGLRSERDSDAWRAVDPPPYIYFAAIALHPETPVEAVSSAAGSVCDPWQTLDLANHGFKAWRREPWMYRPPGDPPGALPAELEIIRVTTPAEVERLELVSVRGFSNDESQTIAPGTFHPPSILEEPRMVMWLGQVEGKPVGAAMSYRTDEAVGIFGVTTIPTARRRGYGGALTSVALLTDTGLPAVLAPSPEGEPVYARLGFERVGELLIWSRKA
jgi:acetyltransferase (GNAT) family protein